MQKLTVLIPSIGRDSLVQAINSVPEYCECIVSISTKDYIEMGDIKSKLIRKAFFSFSTNRLSAGESKQALINSVYTPWFLIVDDDDLVCRKFLDFAVKRLDKGDIDYILPKGILVEGDNRSFKCTPKIAREKLFRYEKWSPEYWENHIYPNSSIIVNTELWKNLGVKYEDGYADDAIPVSKYLLTYQGICMRNSGIFYLETANSVSRSHYTAEDIKEVLTHISHQFLTCDKCDEDYWSTLYRNILLRVKHINNG